MPLGNCRHPLPADLTGEGRRKAALFPHRITYERSAPCLLSAEQDDARPLTQWTACTNSAVTDGPMADVSELNECLCAICALKIEFDLDPHLLEEIEKHNCVIFAGSGISTEFSGAHPDRFYDEVADAAGITDGRPLPQLVDAFEVRPNGRQKLIELIVKRFEYIDSFRELRDLATRFHRELSTMPYIGGIITTNWDRYFENECGATPFVYQSDVPFYEFAKRPVLKIHGSIDNFASIVASTADYAACEERLREGALGAVLKQIFATKTVIFCGYSATDTDLLNIYNAVRTGLGAFARTHYLVSPFLTDSDRERLTSLNIIGVKTDGTHFLSTIKDHMVSKFCFANDESFEAIGALWYVVVDAHEKFVSSYRPGAAPHLIFATVYQDGLIHALERILDLRKTGRYSDLHYVEGQIRLYEKYVAEHLKDRNYWEVSYFTGYLTGLEAFVFLNRLGGAGLPPVPLFFHPGVGLIENAKDFDKHIRRKPEIHKASLAQAKRILRRSGMANAEVIQHAPWG